MTIANCLTMLRIVLIPFFVTALIYRQLGWALGIFISAVVTDVLDGFVARRTRITTLGIFLDPLADKMLLVSAFVLLPVITSFPIWVSVIVVSREVILGSGYLLIYLIRGSKRIEVRVLGKLTTFMQSFCVGMTILSMLIQAPGPVTAYSAYSVAIITVLSGIDYIYQAIRHTPAVESTHKHSGEPF